MSEPRTRRKYYQKRQWLLDYIAKRPFQRITLCEGELEEAYSKEFEVQLKYYTLGPSSCPDLARTLRRMWQAGELKRSTGGNQDASYYCQKTYYVSYHL